jgi:hypothetical protein
LESRRCASHDFGATPERCGELRDHLIDVRLREATAGKQMPSLTNRPPIRVASGPSVHAGLNDVVMPTVPNVAIDVAAHRAAMKAAFGDKFVATCQQKMTADQLNCLLAAETSAAADHCSTAPVSPAQRTASK